MTITLYYSPGVGSLASHIILEESGLPYNIVKVDIKDKKLEDGSDYSKINNKGGVPAIKIEGDVIITESIAILEYIADKKGDHAVLPAVGAVERYKVLETLSFLALDVYKNYGSLFRLSHDETKAKIKEGLLGSYALLDKQLEGHEFLVGKFSIADAYFFTINRFHTYVGVDLSPFKNVLAFQKHIGDRPAVQKVLKTEGLA